MQAPLASRTRSSKHITWVAATKTGSSDVKIGLLDVSRSSPLGDTGALECGRGRIQNVTHWLELSRGGMQRWHLSKKGKKEKERKEKVKKKKKKMEVEKKMASLSFSKAEGKYGRWCLLEHKMLEHKDGICLKRKKKRRKRWHPPALARKRESRKMAPFNLCPQIISQQGPAPQTKDLKLASESVSHNSRNFSKCLCYARCSEWVYTRALLRATVHHFSGGLIGLRNPISLQSQMFRGAHIWDADLQSWVPDVGYKPFAPQGEAWGFEFPPDCESPCQSGIYSDIVSQLFLLTLMWIFFSFYSVYMSCLACFFLQRRWLSVGSVCCWEDMSPDSSYLSHIPPLFLKMYKFIFPNFVFKFLVVKIQCKINFRCRI